MTGTCEISRGLRANLRSDVIQRSASCSLADLVRAAKVVAAAARQQAAPSQICPLFSGNREIF